jgi:hypothetical protein
VMENFSVELRLIKKFYPLLRILIPFNFGVQVTWKALGKRKFIAKILGFSSS